jgi:hypothetical protein
MSISHKSRAVQRITLVLVLVLAFLLLNPSVGFSAGKAKSVITTQSVTIDGKTGYGVVAGERRFRVTKATTIVDAGGTEIMLSALPVPCRARITYRQGVDGYPVALRIKLR